jgi:hypothetical protein
MAGILHRVTPDQYNLYNEEEKLLGTIHKLPTGDTWYGIHKNLDEPSEEYGISKVTGTFNSRHKVAEDMVNTRRSV